MRGPGRDIWAAAGRMGPALRHRGPDDAGWLAAWAAEGRCAAVRDLQVARREGQAPPDVVLAHRRLSIVDLTTGWQPIGNESGDVWIVYNGEIYNHLALRAELEGLGHRFTTRADTEMVVHAYEAWGCGAFERFNGIFAFAIWDARRRSLIVARDPLGVKPVYVGAAAGSRWFASEVKAAIQAELCTPAVNRAALDLYLAYRFVPSPQTLFRGVTRVPPGHWVEAKTDSDEWSEPARFAPPPAAQDEAVPLEEWVDRLAAATRAAVAGQLMADVPVGALLSGGLDSSIVVEAIRERQSGPVATYAIGFGETRGDSELTAARRAAAALGTDHREVVADESGFFSEWTDTISQIDEPVATPGHVLVRMLCRRVRDDLKVVLTGQGADEPLGGYLRHTPERWIRILGRPPIAALLRAGASWLPNREQARRLASVTSERDLARRIAAAFAVFSPTERRSLLGPAARADTAPDAELEPVNRWLAGTEGLDSLNRLLYVDARTSLADDLLLGTDKVGMVNSVEVRVPFLDLGYLAVAERIPGPAKISAVHGRKRLQTLVARRTLPAALARDLAATGRGWARKRGFDIPARRWVEPARVAGVRELLLGAGAALPDYLVNGAMEAILAAHESGRVDHTRRIMSLVTLEAWHRAFIGGDMRSVGLLLGRRADA